MNGSTFSKWRTFISPCWLRSHQQRPGILKTSRNYEQVCFPIIASEQRSPQDQQFWSPGHEIQISDHLRLSTDWLSKTHYCSSRLPSAMTTANAFRVPHTNYHQQTPWTSFFHSKCWFCASESAAQIKFSNPLSHWRLCRPIPRFTTSNFWALRSWKQDKIQTILRWERQAAAPRKCAGSTTLTEHLHHLRPSRWGGIEEV